MIVSKSIPVLYIHPKSQLMFKEIIPHSIPALMNQIDYPVLGRFEEELDEREIKQAKLVIMDIHWYLTLPSAFKLSFRLKKINPSLMIIAGGITATIYAKQLVKHSAIDYVICGDAEEPLPQLVDQILNKGNPQKVSNIVHRDFVSDWNFAVTQEILDKLNYTNYDFFPSFQKGIYRFHSYKGGRPFATHPICIPLRGCPSFCNDCMGSINNQQILFNRKPVRKSNHRVKDELMEISNHPNLHYVNFYHDFLANAPESYYKNILNTHYNLNLYYEFKKTPDKEQLQALMAAFNGGILCFPIDKKHTTSVELNPLNELIERLKQVQKSPQYTLRLMYSSVLGKENPEYYQAINIVHKETGVPLWDVSFWWADYPKFNELGEGQTEDFWFYVKNKGQTYRMVNMIARTGIKAYNYFPRIMHSLSEMIYGSGVLTNPDK